MGVELPAYRFPTLAEYAAQARSIDGLTPQQTHATETALTSTLTEILGNDFPNLAIARRHPLMRLLVFGAPWTRLELISLAQDVEATRRGTGFERLRAQLRDWDRFSEAWTLISLGAALVRSGYDVDAEAPMPIGNRVKHPDLTVSRAGAIAFVIELKQLQSTDEEQRAAETSHWIAEALLRTPHSGVWCGVVQRILSQPRLRQITEAISRAQEQLASTGFETVEVDGAVSIALAGSAEDPRFKAFAQLHGLDSGMLAGPDARGSESQRVVSALKTKRHQCSPDLPSLLIIQCSARVMHGRALPEVVAEIRERLGSYEAVSGAILIGQHLGQIEKASRNLAGATYICGVHSDVVCRHLLFVRNPFAKNAVSDGDWKEIQTALARGDPEG